MTQAIQDQVDRNTAASMVAFDRRHEELKALVDGVHDRLSRTSTTLLINSRDASRSAIKSAIVFANIRCASVAPSAAAYPSKDSISLEPSESSVFDDMVLSNFRHSTRISFSMSDTLGLLAIAEPSDVAGCQREDRNEPANSDAAFDR